MDLCAGSVISSRAYSLHVLDAIRDREERGFGDILSELGISPTTLSRTLNDLLTEGLVERRVYGRRSFYSITRTGLDALEKAEKGSQFDIDRMSQIVAKRLREKRVLDELPDIPGEEFARVVRARVKRLIEQVEEEIRSDLGES